MMNANNVRSFLQSDLRVRSNGNSQQIQAACEPLVQLLSTPLPEKATADQIFQHEFAYKRLNVLLGRHISNALVFTFTLPRSLVDFETLAKDNWYFQQLSFGSLVEISTVCLSSHGGY